MLMHCSQTCIKGVNNLDPHIGGDKLHCACYKAVLPHWDEWSAGYEIPLKRIILWGIKILAAIARKACMQPAQNQDAIWEFFFKKRGKSPVATFKANEVKLAVVISFTDIERAEKWRKKKYNLGPPDSDSKCILSCY